MIKLHPLLQGKKAVLFDLDGTLMDSMGLWGDVDIEFLGNRGYEVPEGLQTEIEGMSFTETAVYFKNRFALTESIEEIKNIWLDMAYRQYAHEVEEKPGASAFVQFLYQQGIKMAVASSNARELILASLDHHQMSQYFDAIVVSCEVKKGKPAPDVYLEAARRLGVEPEDCLVFEDIVSGILAGKNAGMQTVAIYDYYAKHQDQEKKELADAFIQDYYDLMEA